MKLDGSFDVAAPIAAVWEIFQDPDALCSLATSCESARQLDQTHYEGVIRIRLAMLSARAFVLGTVLAQDPPHTMRVAIEGRTTGLPGQFHGVAELWLRSNGDSTHGEFTMELDVLGRLGSLGQPLFQTAGQRLVSTFADKVSRRLRVSAAR